MRVQTIAAQVSPRTALDLTGLRTFSGAPAAFWSSFCQQITTLAGARAGAVFIRRLEGGTSGAWRRISASPANSAAAQQLDMARNGIETLATAAVAQGEAMEHFEDAPVLGIALQTGEPQMEAAALFLLEEDPEPTVEEAALRLRLVADTPALYGAHRALLSAREESGHFAGALDLMLLLNNEQRFMAAAMLICNEIAARFTSDRVSLGWRVGPYVRLQAVSHSDKFEKKMEVVQELEAAMEECADQDMEIAWPAAPEATYICRDHEHFAAAQASGSLLSLPLREKQEAVAVLLLERKSSPFAPQEVRGLRVACDQMARRLADLRRQDRWFGARWAASARRQAAKLLGTEHTGWKLLGLALALALAILIFGQKEHRVDSAFELKSDAVAQLPAPFEGYISEVHFRIGDEVQAGQTLVRLDTRETLLQQAAALAELQRYEGEAQRAEAAGELADLGAAAALARQAKARLDLAEYHLSQAEIRAPFAGVIVEGDLRERVAGPVQQGEVLLKIARLGEMFAELKINQRDIPYVQQAATGELAFSSRPQQTFPMQVQRIEPVAQPTEEGNFFIVRTTLPSTIEPWWRPGMNGVAKVNAGRRSLWWIVTHRTADFLRLQLWW